MNQRPLTAGELESLAEYLWQFTMFNNSDYAVESSSTRLSGGALVQTIRMGKLVRGARRLRHRADRRLDPHDERDRWLDHPRAHERADVQGEEHRAGVESWLRLIGRAARGYGVYKSFASFFR